MELRSRQQLPAVSSRRSSVCVHASGNTAVAAQQAYRSKPANQVNVLVVGPTGYIGR
jgi:hypothetical protein